jgi:hypothetical protein
MVSGLPLRWRERIYFKANEVTDVCCGATGSMGRITGKEVGTEHSIEATVCSYRTSVKFTTKETFSTIETTHFASGPCTCATPAIERTFCIFPRRHPECLVNRHGVVLRTYQIDSTIKVPISKRVVTVQYAPNPPCSPTCAERGNPESLAPVDPADPRTLPRELPVERPTRDEQELSPWVPAEHGAVPLATAAAPAWQRQGVSLYLDLTDYFIDRKIESSLDLTLAETRAILRGLQRLKSEFSGLIDNSTPVRVELSSFMKLDGKLGPLDQKLRDNVRALVNSPSYGDFNDDKRRDHEDLALLNLQVDHPANPINEQRRYDLNGDDLVDIEDVIAWVNLAQ